MKILSSIVVALGLLISHQAAADLATVKNALEVKKEKDIKMAEEIKALEARAKELKAESNNGLSYEQTPLDLKETQNIIDNTNLSNCSLRTELSNDQRTLVISLGANIVTATSAEMLFNFSGPGELLLEAFEYASAAKIGIWFNRDGSTTRVQYYNFRTQAISSCTIK